MKELIKELTSVVPVLVGGSIAILGTYVNGVAQTRSQQQNERKKILLDKLEETYETAAKVGEGFKGNFGKALLRLPNNKTQIQEESKIYSDIPIERLLMYIDLYFNELKSYFDEVVKGRDELGEYLAASIKKCNASQDERSRLKSEMMNKYQQVDCACNEFLKAVSKLTVRLF
jgi:hypothetical protein